MSKEGHATARGRRAGQGANRRFQIMFRKFCFRKQAAGGFRRRGPTRRAFARCVRCRCTGFFSAVGRACLARHGAALIVGLAAPRRPRRQPRRLQLLVLGLRLPAASCLVGVALQPHIVAAWRRPPRGAPAGPRCPGRMRSGRPFKVADACCGLVHAQRPSGEYGLRGVARAFLCVRDRGERGFVFSASTCVSVGVRYARGGPRAPSCCPGPAEPP